MTESTKTCPYCAETIKVMAVKCRYCGSDFTGRIEPEPALSPKKPTMKKSEKKFLLGMLPMILLICACPIAFSIDDAYGTTPLFTAIVALGAVCMLAVGVLSGTVKLFG